MIRLIKTIKVCPSHHCFDILSLYYLYYTTSLFRTVNLLKYEYLGEYVRVFQYTERTDAIRTGIGELVALVLACSTYLHNEIEMKS